MASDLPSALVRTHAPSVVSVAIPAERKVDEIVVVDLAGGEGLSYGRIEICAGAFSKATIVLRLDMTTDVSGIVVTDVADQADLTVLALYDGPRTSRHVWLAGGPNRLHQHQRKAFHRPHGTKAFTGSDREHSIKCESLCSAL